MYQKKYILFSIILLLAIATVVAIAQESPADPNQLSAPPPQLVPLIPNESQPSQTIQIPLVPVAVDASNSCETATVLTVPGGGSQIVNAFDTDSSDPQINQCFWAPSGNAKGYRTAWFQFTAPHNGIATVDTFGSNYDTVAAIHVDNDPAAAQACSDLRLLRCNDDYNGFTARTTFGVQKNQTYYIEVVDWQSGVSGNAELRLSLVIEDIESSWVSVGSMTNPRTRHATVIVDDAIYTIGGQKNTLVNPEILASMDRYDVASQSWTELARIPGEAGVGLSNTTAVYVSTPSNDDKCTDGCIYLPGGYDGGNTYNGTHWAYDIATGEWIERKNIFNLSPLTHPFAWSTAVAHPNNTGYYLIGGLTTQPPITTTAQAHNHVFFYNIESDEWHTNPPDMVAPRYGHMATQLGNEICVVGGISTNLTLIPSGECFSPNGGGGWVPSIPSLNIARYGAGSAVGPDGKWYIFGGSDANHAAVPSIEVYDPNNAAAGWQLLPVSYDLGASEGVLERAWPRGGFVGNHLYAIGGNSTQTTFSAIPTIERLFIGSQTTYLPVVYNGVLGNNDTLATAGLLGFNSPVFNHFEGQLDFFDTYYFDLPTTDQVTIKLSQIPTGSNYDVSVYDGNKLLWGRGDNVGTFAETVPLTLSNGRYYVVVERVLPFGFPNTANYRLIVER